MSRYFKHTLPRKFPSKLTFWSPACFSLPMYPLSISNKFSVPLREHKIDRYLDKENWKIGPVEMSSDITCSFKETRCSWDGKQKQIAEQEICFFNF